MLPGDLCAIRRIRLYYKRGEVFVSSTRVTMDWTRRQSLQFGLGALAAISGLRGAAAQDYPARPVTLVVPFAPGGGLDMIARQLQPLLEQRLGKPLLIENRPRAGTMIGAAAVAKAAPDGYTLLFGSASPLAIAVSVNKNPPYDPVRDFVPIAMIGNAAFVFVVTPDLGVSTLADFITLAKDNPGQLSFGSGGNGSIQHLFSELLQTMAGIRMVHVPYRGDNPVLNDIVAGHIPAAFRRDGRRHAVHQCGQGAGARRIVANTRACHARHSDNCGGRRSRLQRRVMADVRRPRRDAGGNRPAAARRCYRGAGQARGAGRFCARRPRFGAAAVSP